MYRSRWGNGTAALIALALLSSAPACKEVGDTTADKRLPGEDASPYPAQLTYWVPMDTEAAVTLRSYSEMGLYKQLENVTGTRVTFRHPPAGEAQARDQFHLMMASGDLPDVIFTNWISNAPDKAIRDGKIRRLNELIERYAPNLSALLKEKPYLRKEITSDEGNIYMFPSIADDPPQFAYHGLMIRKDWLDKLHLSPPATIAEWETVLSAFRDGDPNGNGKKDEIPFFYRQTDLETSYPFIGAFGITPGFYQENGVVKYGPLQPAYKEFLALMNQWYEAGLIDRDYLTSDIKIRDGRMLDNQLGSMAGWAGSGLGTYLQLMKGKQPSFRLVGVPFPSLQAGVPAVSKAAQLVNGYGAAISANAAHPEQVAAWLDYGYGEAGSLLYNFGVEGESYTLVQGTPQYTDLILHNPRKLTVSQALSSYALQAASGPFASDKEADKQWHVDPEQTDAMTVWMRADHSKDLPNMLLNAEEQMKFASIMTDLLAYKDNMVNQFIMGTESLSRYNDFALTLRKLGIEEAVRLNQTAYDRYRNRYPKEQR